MQIIKLMSGVYFFWDSGYKNDIFWGETNSWEEEATDRWCVTGDPPLLPEMSAIARQVDPLLRKGPASQV